MKHFFSGLFRVNSFQHMLALILMTVVFSMLLSKLLFAVTGIVTANNTIPALATGVLGALLAAIVDRAIVLSTTKKE
jgi:hypothetical protein